MAKTPQMISGRMFVVADIAGGGAAEDGSGIVVEFQMLDRTVAPFQFARQTAQKLLSAAQRLLFEAEKRAGKQDTMSGAGALSINLA
jgi:hypothetical protein